MTTTMIDVQPCCSKSTTPSSATATTVVTYSLPLLMILILLILPVTTASTNCSSIIDSIIFNGGGGIGYIRPTTLLSTGSDLRVCSAPIGRTCCNRQLETQMVNTSGRELERRVQDRIIVLRHTFESRSSRFDRLFRDMLSNSSRELHTMFTQTYGPFYVRNAHIFSQLFDNLTDYYTHGESNVGTTLDSFFHTLYRRMYALMNPLIAIDDERWLCMRPTMVELAPFGDVPQKMRQQVERSLVAARVFVQAMATARDVLPVAADTACIEGVVRMRYCAMCQHVPPLIDVKACNGFCLNVLKACVAPSADIDLDWNAFVDALLNLLDRLKGPYNLENVISPMNVHISEAIMIFQERGQIITSKVSDHCFGGDQSTSPIVIRPKRNNAAALRSSMSAASPLASLHSSTSTLEQMARELREKIVAMKGFWRSLPQTLCNDATFATPADDDRRACWNGRTIGKYTKVLVGDGTANQSSNPEVNGTIADQSIIGIVTDQILKLRISTNRMKRAYEGRSVDKAEQSLLDDDSPVISHQQIPMNDFEMSGSGDDDEHSNGHRQRLNSLTTDDEDLTGRDSSGDGSPPIVAVKGSHRDDELNEQNRQTSNSWSITPSIRTNNDNDVVISEVETRPPRIYVNDGSSIVATQYLHHLIIIVVLICFRFV